MISIHKNIWGRITSWTHYHRTTTILLVSVGILLSTAMAVGALMYRSPQPITANTPLIVKKIVTPAPVIYYSPLTGEKVPDMATTQQAVTGIMIENSPDARPQSGLKSAGVVYEAIAEGGITRFLTLFQQQKPQLIGPVRSVRLYYVDWVAPFQASIAHVGGSKFALDEVRNGSYRDIDQFFNGASYWRATDRYAPHNVYTSFEKLDALNAKKGYTTSAFTSWARKDGAASNTPAGGPTATNINVTISGPLYNSRYQYDAASNSYLRFEGGAPHNDREAGQIAPNVVIVMDTVMTQVFEDGYREQITTTGTGRARIFQDGVVIEGNWSKKDRGSQIIFSDSTGKEIPLDRGQTWITAVPANQGGKVTWQ